MLLRIEEVKIKEFTIERLLVVLILVVALSYSTVIIELIQFWWGSEEYNYGLVIPFVIGYIVYKNKSEIFNKSYSGSKLGLWLTLVSLVLFIMAIRADIDSVKRYSMLLTAAGGILILGGTRLLEQLFFPLVLILLSFPPPAIVGVAITSKMQLISTDIGVWLLQLLNLPVTKDGNVINMAGFNLLVAEACSGLRYLYPLCVIALVVGYFLRAPLGLRVCVIFLAIPITITMNSFRIAATGVLIHFYGRSSAEGFLHDFEGFIVFGIALVLLLFSVWLVTTLYSLTTHKQRTFIDWFDLNSSAKNTQIKPSQHINMALFLFVLFNAIAGIANYQAINQPHTTIPQRMLLADFPFKLDGREIFPQVISTEIQQVLQADDHLLADYRRMTDGDKINLYIAYYNDQKDGQALHSPKACLPGGGWRLTSTETVDLTSLGGTGSANRVIIEQQNQRMLVYYWVSQAGTNYASELLARSSLLWNSILIGRTDGALIRVIKPIINNDIHSAETETKSFINTLFKTLPDYIPGR